MTVFVNKEEKISESGGKKKKRKKKRERNKSMCEERNKQTND